MKTISQPVTANAIFRMRALAVLTAPLLWKEAAEAANDSQDDRGSINASCLAAKAASLVVATRWPR